MNYYCILVETGKEEVFRKEVQKKLDEGLFPFQGKILLFRQIKKIVKLNKVYDDPLFPGYLFFKTEENDTRKFQVFSKLEGFLMFLPNRKEIKVLSKKDTAVVTELERNGELQGFLRVKFDLNDRLTIVGGSLAGIEGEVIKVNRRNHKLNMNLVMSNGIKVVNLSYFDVEKEDWSDEEKKYMVANATK